MRHLRVCNACAQMVDGSDINLLFIYMYVYSLQSQLATTCMISLEEELFKPTTVQASLFDRLDARHMLPLAVQRTQSAFFPSTVDVFEPRESFRPLWGVKTGGEKPGHPAPN